ncbi:hypothetical protein AB0K51_16875 [Kitasatospora sp. NPDC049285]|uniref:hypothetical protein n=1 Tax=Kitasatospora sp. NPDC049285 TaxID=3157096 RepID=UPI0034149E91
MSQRRSYPNSGEFNLDDLFRPEPAGDGQGNPAGAAAQQQPAVPQQQSAPPLGQSGAPEYWGAPQQPAAAPAADPAPATQYLPPYPNADPAVGGAPQAYPAAGQAPTPPQGYGGTFGGQQQPQQYQAAPQQPQQYPSYGGQQPGYPPQPEAPAAPSWASAEERRKVDPKILIGAGVAGVALIAVLIGVLSSGGDSGKDKGTTVAQKSSAPSTGASSGAVTPEMKAQAQAMSDLLGTASSSRSSVVNAVTAVGKCQGLPDAQAALTAAASQRQDLLKKLGDLKVDQLPDGAKLVEQLQKAWQASSGADSEYALWAGDLVAGCDAGKAKDNDHYRNGNTASGSATTAKEQAAGLWGAIATKTGLPNKGASEL